METKSRNMKIKQITLRLTPSELAEITRKATGEDISRVEYIRRCIFEGSSSPASLPPEEIEEIRDQLGEHGRALDDIREVLTDILKRIEDMGGEIAENFNELVQGIKELIRVPSFREFRGRCIVEGWEKHPKETDSEFTIRVAKAYFQKYGIWPDPVARPKDFGPLPKDMTGAWPKSPK